MEFLCFVFVRGVEIFCLICPHRPGGGNFKIVIKKATTSWTKRPTPFQQLHGKPGPGETQGKLGWGLPVFPVSLENYSAFS